MNPEATGTISVRPLADLHESEENPRTISDERLESLRYALRESPEMMSARPLIATPDGEVVCGNMRLRVLKEDGVEAAPTFTRDFTPAEKREWMLRDNNEYGEWVPDEVAALVRAHSEDQADMRLLGFAEPQLDAMLKADLGDGAGGGDPDPTATTGEVWGVVVDCDTEAQQAELVEELSGRGLEVRALIPE